MEAGSPSKAEERRTIALCVSVWNHPTNFYAWNWLKQWFLRRSPANVEDRLHPSDNLLIVRVGKHLDDTDKWKIGGPLIPDLDTALQNYPHTILKLQGSIQSQLRNLIEQHSINVVVLGDEFPQSGFQLTSVTDWVKEKVSCPFIVIRPAAVRNVKMRITSAKDPTLGGSSSPPPAGEGDAAAAAEGAPRASSPPPVPPTHGGRKICIAYSRFDVGQHLMQVAKTLVLEPEDTVYVAHCFPTSGAGSQWLHPTQMMRQAGKLVRGMTFQRSGSQDQPVTPDNSIDFGAKELEDYKVVLNVVLRGDPKHALERFAESEGLDLLVIGTRAGGKLRKTLTGGSVSSYLIDRAPCPCLTIPYKAMGIGAESSLSGEEEGPTSPQPSTSLHSSPFGPGSMVAAAAGVDAAVQTESTVAPPQAASVAQQLEVGGAASTAGAAAAVHSTPSDMLTVLQAQLEEKDKVIGELRAQVQQLQLQLAQSRETQTHDPMHGGSAAY